MSADEADRPAKQFEQSTPSQAEIDRSHSARLHEHYKSIGISAVSAAAHFTSTSKKKGHQMS